MKKAVLALLMAVRLRVCVVGCEEHCSDNECSKVLLVVCVNEFIIHLWILLILLLLLQVLIAVVVIIIDRLVFAVRFIVVGACIADVVLEWIQRL